MLRATYLAVLGIVITILAGCVSAEQQRAMDQQKCASFGFASGTDGFANCMMGISQQREAEAAAQRRQQEHDQMIADQIEKDRQAKERAAAKAAEDERYNDWLRMSGHSDMVTTPSGTPSP